MGHSLTAAIPMDNPYCSCKLTRSWDATARTIATNGPDGAVVVSRRRRNHAAAAAAAALPPPHCRRRTPPPPTMRAAHTSCPAEAEIDSTRACHACPLAPAARRDASNGGAGPSWMVLRVSVQSRRGSRPHTENTCCGRPTDIALGDGRLRSNWCAG